MRPYYVDESRQRLFRRSRYSAVTAQEALTADHHYYPLNDVCATGMCRYVALQVGSPSGDVRDRELLIG